MKVLMISTDRLIFKSGSEVRRRILDYGDLFDELHVIVFCRRNLGFKTEQLTDNVFVHPTNSSNRLGYIRQAVKLGWQLFSVGGDWVISSQDPFETGLVAWYLRREKNFPWQAQIHTDFLSPSFRSESWLNWLRVVIARFLLPRADRIRVVSERIKRSLIDWRLKTEPVVLPIFVTPLTLETCSPEADLHHQYPQFSFIILMASRLTKEKNFPLAIGAFAAAALDRPNIGLLIVGNGPERSNLIRLAKTFKAGRQIVFEDWQDKLSCYYQTADLFLLTSNYEGYGRTLIEAGLRGCPVLTTEIGLVGETINNENGLTCPVEDEECLAEKIGWAVANHRELKLLGQKLKNQLEKDSLSSKEYLRRYREAILGN